MNLKRLVSLPFMSQCEQQTVSIVTMKYVVFISNLVINKQDVRYKK